MNQVEKIKLARKHLGQGLGGAFLENTLNLLDEFKEINTQGQTLPIDSVMPCFEFSGKATKYNQGVAVDTDGISLSNDILPHKAYTLEEGVKYTVKLYKA